MAYKQQEAADTLRICLGFPNSLAAVLHLGAVLWSVGRAVAAGPMGVSREPGHFTLAAFYDLYDDLKKQAGLIQHAQINPWIMSRKSQMM